MNTELHIRAYEDTGTLHSHDFLQLVLPIEGELEIEVGGHGARLTSGLSAFIAPGEIHTQAGWRTNRSLVLDASAEMFPSAVLDRFERRRFFTASPDLQHLMDYARLRSDKDSFDSNDRSALARLLTSTLGSTPLAPSATERLEAEISRTPAADWSVARMAKTICVSRSGLYRCLAAEGLEAPGGLVTRIRLKIARRALADHRLSLAEIALRCGFSDQAALTRAMRRETGRTPGDWRRRKDTLSP